MQKCLSHNGVSLIARGLIFTECLLYAQHCVMSWKFISLETWALPSSDSSYVMKEENVDF